MTYHLKLHSHRNHHLQHTAQNSQPTQVDFRRIVVNQAVPQRPQNNFSDHSVLHRLDAAFIVGLSELRERLLEALFIIQQREREGNHFHEEPSLGGICEHWPTHLQKRRKNLRKQSTQHTNNQNFSLDIPDEHQTVCCKTHRETD
jgi:hypothetical protein